MALKTISTKDLKRISVVFPDSFGLPSVTLLDKIFIEYRLKRMFRHGSVNNYDLEKVRKLSGLPDAKPDEFEILTSLGFDEFETIPGEIRATIPDMVSSFLGLTVRPLKETIPGAIHRFIKDRSAPIAALSIMAIAFVVLVSVFIVNADPSHQQLNFHANHAPIVPSMYNDNVLRQTAQEASDCAVAQEEIWRQKQSEDFRSAVNRLNVSELPPFQVSKKNVSGKNLANFGVPETGTFDVYITRHAK